MENTTIGDFVAQTFKKWRVPLLGGAGYALLAAMAIELTSQHGGVAAVWPANAAVLAFLLLNSKDCWHRFLIAALAGNIIANILTRDAFVGPLLFGASNLLEITIAALALHGSVRRENELFHDRTSMTRFLVWAGGIAPALSSVLGAATASIAFGENFREAITVWYCSDALGLVLFTPFFYSLFSGQYGRSYRAMAPSGRIEAFALQILVLLSAGIFAQNTFPLLFVPFLPLMLVTFRLGWRGTSMSVLIIAAAGMIFSPEDMGPISLIQGAPHEEQLFLQFYLACIVLVNMPVAAALSAKRRLIDTLGESERMIDLLSAESSIAILSIGPDGLCTMAAGQTSDVFGKQPAALQGMLIEEIFDSREDDCFDTYVAALKNPARPSFCEILLADGRSMEASFSAVYHDGDVFGGTLVTISEITHRKVEEDRLKHIARTDPLTGVLNRAGFMEQLKKALEDDAQSFCLAVFDIDQFKVINDNEGHLTGDAVLEHLTSILRHSVRGSDIVARLGGDEFVLLMLHTRLPYATNICDRVVRTVHASPLARENGRKVSLSVSCGLVEHVLHESVERLIDRADTALYAAKGGGRNCLRAA